VLDQGQHAACVDAWLDCAARDLPPRNLLLLFEAALGALWARTMTTLGEVTLTAIAERVVHNAGERFPFLSSLKVDPSGGIQCRDLYERLGGMRGSQLMEGMRFVVVEFLTVLGNLTAEILTPDLHAALSKTVPPESARVDRGASGNTPPPVEAEGEEKRS
jgi:hypothetical protein